MNKNDNECDGNGSPWNQKAQRILYLELGVRRKGLLEEISRDLKYDFKCS